MTSEILREREFYDALSDCLKERKFAKFESLINESITRDIFIDPKKIPNRFLILNELLIECMQNVSEGYQTSSLGDFIDILRFFNQHGLFERNLTNKELEIAEKYGKDQILIAALIDLCGGASSYFISYLFKDVATLIYNLFINNPSSYFVDAEGFFEYIKSGFFNLYTIYGLSVRYLCPVDQFIKELEPITNFSTKNENQNEKNDNDFVRINLEYRNVYYDYVTEIPREQTEIKTHLVSISNIIRFLNRLDDKENYRFYSLSMVLMGGIGPQGRGFTYSTPKGEVVEICSDMRENEAIIIKYKKFLKHQFLERLIKKLQIWHVDEAVIIEINSYLENILSNNEIIHYYKKDALDGLIKEYLETLMNSRKLSKSQIENLYLTITKAVKVVLRPIRMIDQFKARMNLVSQGKLRAEDIAKLTSLERQFDEEERIWHKSHYDVLRERLFYQYLTDSIYDIYLENTAR